MFCKRDVSGTVAHIISYFFKTISLNPARDQMNGLNWSHHGHKKPTILEIRYQSIGLHFDANNKFDAQSKSKNKKEKKMFFNISKVIASYGFVLTTSFAVFILYIIGAARYLTQHEENTCDMTYMFEYPQFVVSYQHYIFFTYV